jgi:hypothetical protein
VQAFKITKTDMELLFFQKVLNSQTQINSRNWDTRNLYSNPVRLCFNDYIYHFVFFIVVNSVVATIILHISDCMKYEVESSTDVQSVGPKTFGLKT